MQHQDSGGMRRRHRFYILYSTRIVFANIRYFTLSLAQQQTERFIIVFQTRML